MRVTVLYFCAMMTATEYPHIELDDAGRAFIKGTRFKVIQIVKDRCYYDWPAEEIQRQHAQLTLPQVYTALAYFYDHRESFEAQLAAEEQADQEFIASQPRDVLRDRLRNLARERGTL